MSGSSHGRVGRGSRGGFDPLPSMLNGEETKTRVPSAFEECMNHFGVMLSEWGYDLIAVVVSIADVMTDIVVMWGYHRKGHLTFFYLSLSIVIIAQLCYCYAFTMRYSRTNDSCALKMCRFVLVLPVSPLLSFVFFWSSIPGNCLGPWMRDHFNLDVQFYNPDDHPEDSEMRKWVKAKLDKHMGFILEAIIEAFPQSLLQMTALVYYGNGQVSGVAIASILLSLLSVCSKSLVFSQALVPSLFLFNWLCLVSDFIGVFTVISWVFAPASGDAVSLFSSSFWVFGSFNTLGQMYCLVICVAVLPTIIWCSIALTFIFVNETYVDSTSRSFRRESVIIQSPILCCCSCIGIVGFAVISLMVTIFVMTPTMSLLALTLHWINFKRFSLDDSDFWLKMIQFLNESYFTKNAMKTCVIRLIRALFCTFETSNQNEPYLSNNFRGYDTSVIDGPGYIESMIAQTLSDTDYDIRDLSMRLAVLNLFLSSVRCSSKPTLHRNLHHLFFDQSEVPVKPMTALNVKYGKRSEQFNQTLYYRKPGVKISKQRMITVKSRLFEKDGWKLVTLQRQRQYFGCPSSALFLGSLKQSYLKLLKWSEDGMIESQRSYNNSYDSSLQMAKMQYYWVWIETYLFAPFWLSSRLIHWVFPLICLLNACLTQGFTNIWNGRLAFQSYLSVLYVSLQCVIWSVLIIRVIWLFYVTWHILPGAETANFYFSEDDLDGIAQDVRDFYDTVICRPIYEQLLIDQLGYDVGKVVVSYLPTDFAYHRWFYYMSRIKMKDVRNMLTDGPVNEDEWDEKKEDDHQTEGEGANEGGNS